MRDEDKTKEQLIKELAGIRNYVAELEETGKRQAYYDILTGLPNRVLFIDHLKLALTHVRRSRRMLAVMFLDLDRFKTINDSLGYAAGDHLLKAVSYRLKACLREGDTIARVGGDEYAVVLPQVSHDDDAVKISKKIIAAFREPYEIGGHELRVTVSLGISLYPEDGRDADTLMQNADAALYHAREQGGNNYQFYSKAMNLKAFRRILMESSLRKALENGGLTVYYQPQVDISTGKIVCAEALVRWRHPELGLLNPKQFMPLAEEIGLIRSIDEWVMRTACSQYRAWQAAGLPSLCLIVNLSSSHFMQPDLVERVSKIVHETSMDSRLLDLEINESAVMQDVNANIAKMAKLNDMGIQFSLDDFGREYLSLRRLEGLPIQKLKIDRSYISGLVTDSDYESIVAVVIAMAHNLKLKVVAEGVETVDQLLFLRSKQCDEMQGYLISHPLPADEFEKTMLSHIS